MAVFDHIPAGEAGLQEVYQWVDGLVAANENVARKEIIGKSEEDRDIPAVFITDPNVSDSNKETAIITLARHGQEAGTRVVGAEILNYLVSGDAKDILSSQQVIVIPVANPDGFIRNEFHSHLTRLTRTERTVLGKLFNAYPPDMIENKQLDRTTENPTPLVDNLDRVLGALDTALADILEIAR